ncbi:hypothetical protein PZA11_001355 [Diplocarpon coronariae]|uniref:Uncharacterized protein n=1 Tax=Diplocarpon coronariae TaxID=2795749 RepID=A0A218Z2M5_9HELO|nr:hypothetical protein JHW43_004046 [Diplocarpon mali]OWP01793.1 hypothetical protein B2J93_487 [Marssonina coronariae]
MLSQWGSRKRDRDDDGETVIPGFGEHRSKRRISALPHRALPKTTRQVSPTVPWADNYTSHPPPPTITPVDSDSEEAAATASAEPRSFSSYSSSAITFVQSGSPSPFLDNLKTQHNSQSTQLSNAAMSSEDFEMTDASHLSPGHFQNDSCPSLSGRIPTPIHSSFAPFIRPEKASVPNRLEFGGDQAVVDRLMRGRRLPSPISEGETSPSVIVAGIEDMQMDVDSSHHDQDKQTPTKKGHTRSKHSLRNWTGLGSELAGTGMKRSFSMGYRADCEKCRMKVPGHFSHIITY